MELKFNSQICTSVEQSSRLLELGLNPETADMSYYVLDSEPVLTIGMAQVYRETLKGGKIVETRNAELIPAWSLHRLLEMICNKECEEHYYFDFSMDYDSMADVYDSIIEVIERHIKNNFFNKEYLKP